jgi:hypothetical protein
LIRSLTKTPEKQAFFTFSFYIPADTIARIVRDEWGIRMNEEKEEGIFGKEKGFLRELDKLYAARVKAVRMADGKGTDSPAVVELDHQIHEVQLAVTQDLTGAYFGNPGIYAQVAQDEYVTEHIFRIALNGKPEAQQAAHTLLGLLIEFQHGSQLMSHKSVHQAAKQWAAGSDPGLRLLANKLLGLDRAENEKRPANEETGPHAGKSPRGLACG